ncbi:antitoxin Xre-like helix-turn-helix domain-containing protein [Paraburkholderia sp.]|uniref:antitoxin Xre-like helix-turn-helix domain-containing protein n=1 Tax=Paraburkholderia sp. TaxID=1926495 RepID=UPI003C7CB73D
MATGERSKAATSPSGHPGSETSVGGDTTRKTVTFSARGFEATPSLRKHVVERLTAVFRSKGFARFTDIELVVTFAPSLGRRKYGASLRLSMGKAKAGALGIFAAADNVDDAIERACARLLGRMLHSGSLRFQRKTGKFFGQIPAVEDEEPANEWEFGLPDLTRFREVFQTDPSLQISGISAGIDAAQVARIAQSMDLRQDQLAMRLGLSVSMIDRKVHAGEKLSPQQGERVVGIAKLIGQVQTMVEESGDPAAFDAATWMAAWLDTPLPALGGACPSQYMETADGRELLANLLQMMQSGAYA